MGRLLAENFAKNMSRVATLGVGAGALLAVVALSPIAALALPMGPLNKANNDSAPQLSYQESRIGVSYKDKSIKTTSVGDYGIAERPALTVPVQ